MKFFLTLTLLLLTIPLVANKPAAEFKVIENTDVKHIQAGKFGSLFFYYKKKENKMLFVAGDLTSSFTFDLADYPDDLRVFPGEDAFYITYWTLEKFKYYFNVIKANHSGVVKKARSSDHKHKIDRVTFNGEDILLIEHKKGDYTALRFSGEDLKRKPVLNISLPELGKREEWSLLGSSNGIMRFWGYILPDAEAGIEHPMIYLAMVGTNGKLIKEQAIPIPIPEGRSYIPSHYISSKNYVNQGPLLDIIQSPFSDDIIVYTFVNKTPGSMVWKREGMKLFKLKLDLEQPELVYETFIKHISGEEIGSYSSPYIRFMEDDLMMILLKEKDGGVMSGKYFCTTTLLDNNGKPMIYERSKDSQKGASAIYPGADDIDEFLKTSSKKNSAGFTTISKKLSNSDPDAKLDITKFGDQWLIIQHNKKAGTIKFYKA